ncbi:MAG: flagellar hook-associated protein FlgK [Clostridia bacterium]|nr:flagellar hook-associated protein FlgK [Clostridia bacterium]
MIANFSTMVSGLDNATRGLQVTSQNLTNVNTEGYTRRRIELVDSFYSNIGDSGSGKMQVGSGVTIRELCQIRNTLLDQSYRNENSKLSYYDTEYDVLHEIETLLIDSTDFSETLDSLYGSISVLSQNPESVSARAEFLTSAENFVYEAQYISEQLSDIQLTMNEKIIEQVNKANELLDEIQYYNDKIVELELEEDEASDLRDQRNVCLDELSKIMPITVTEQKYGNVQVYADGRDLFGVGTHETISLRATVGADGFYTPYWTKAGDDVVNMDRALIEDANYQDGGTLKALLMARGNVYADYSTDPRKTELYTIPSIKKNFDTLVHSIVKNINETFAPESHTSGAYSGDGSQYIEVFSRKDMDRYRIENGDYIFNDEDPTNFESLYTTENLVINSVLLNDNNFSKICYSPSGDVGDNTYLEKILAN